MRTIEEALKNKIEALHYGNRVLLPFVVDILKLVVENDIITDFSSCKHGAEYKKHDDYTEIYFKDYKNLEDNISEYETVKLVVVEKGSDIFDLNTHVKLALHFKENHKIELEKLNGDALFFE